MATESDNKTIATTKSSHMATCQPEVSLVNPPPPPTGPAPTGFPIVARSQNASQTCSSFLVDGAPVLVTGSSMDVDTPANQPSQAGGGDVMTHAVSGKGNVTMGSATTTAGGKGVARTGDTVALNCTAPNMQLAQGQGPFVEAGDAAGGSGSADGDATAAGAGGTAQPSNKAGQKNGGASSASDSPSAAGHPVAVASGFVVDDGTDLALPGVIPLTVRRSYSSQRHREAGILGKGGWVLSFEQWVIPEGDVLSVRLEDGRDAYFDPIGPGEHAFHRRERLELHAERGHHGPRYRLWDVKRRLWRLFQAQVPGGKARLVSIADAHGNQITLHYEADRLVRVVDTAGRELRCLYDEEQRFLRRLEVWAAVPMQGGRAAQPDPSALQTWVDYQQDGDECLSSATDAEGHRERYRYDVQRRMVQVTLRNGTSFYYEYEEEHGRCINTRGDNGLHKVELDRRPPSSRPATPGSAKGAASSKPYGEVWTSGNHEPRHYVYTEDGYTLVEEIPGGDFRREETYDDDRYLLSEKNAAGDSYAFGYDERGNRTKVVDPAGNTASWTYRADLPVEHVARDGHKTSYEYDERGSLIAATYPTGERYLIGYDAHGRVETISDQGGVRFAFTYDAHHNLTSQTDARGATTRYWYDALGRPVLRQDALGRVTRVAYDRLGQPIKVTHADESATEAAYDPLGNVTRYLDPLGQETRMRYGGTGVLLELVEPTGQKWRFSYDENERLVRIENPRCERYEYRYDWAGRVVEERPFDGRILRYQYDKGERLCRLERPDDTFRTFSYDRLGNVVEERSSDGGIVFQRDKLGRLLKATVDEPDGRDVVTAFERDELGRIVAEIQEGARIAYSLDQRGRVTTRMLPEEAEGQVTHYRYDRLGACIKVMHDSPAGRHTVDFERDALGREARRRSTTTGSTALEMVRSYDAMDRLLEQQLALPSPGGAAPRVLSGRRWHYDRVGRPTAIEDSRWGGTHYRYDLLGQLLEAKRGPHHEVFDYDVTGSLRNILTEAGGSRERWYLEPGNVLIEKNGTRYENDLCKRRTRKVEPGDNGTRKVTAYRWDVRDRLRDVRLPDGRRLVYRYDAFARRVTKEMHAAASLEEDLARALAGGGGPRAPERTRFLYDGDVLCAELRPEEQGGVRVHVHEARSFAPLLQVERGQVLTVVNDHLGMPKELVDGRGRVAWAATHSAWGRVTEVQRDAGAHEVSSPFRLLGQYADEETGLCYVRFRYFDAEAGRWCSPDPLGFAGGANVHGWRYSPTDSADKLGLTCPKALPNQMKDWYESEVEVANKLGIKPLRPGDPGFDDMIEAGPVKWAVDTNGQIGFIPKLETGQYDVKHSIIAGGGDALSAGTADIVPMGNGRYVATRVDRESGHYQPGPEHLPLGVQKMKEAGIDVPDDSVILALPWD